MVLSVKQLSVGDEIDVRFADGAISATVNSINEDNGYAG